MLPNTFTRRQFPPGYAGTAKTVQLMAQLVRGAAQDPRIRARARQLLAGTDASDFMGRVQVIWEWVLSAITYIDNPVGAQHLTDPVTLDEEIDAGEAGECCASVAMYAAALFATVGIKSEFVIIGYNPSQPSRFKHVFLDVIEPRSGNRVAFDPVGAMMYGEGAFNLGNSLYVPGAPLERWSLDGERVGLGDITEADIMRAVNTGADAAAMFANQFGPYGSLVAAGLEAGKSIADIATGYHAPMTIPPPSPGPQQMLSSRAPRHLPPPGSSSGGLGIAAAGVGLGILAYALL